ncbi:MAG: immunoglobulin domain-containing protein [Ignavibacteriae bacterium]|nr:immunoglobulin domain-containing protein [Ignavibacteriota bacterium]
MNRQKVYFSIAITAMLMIIASATSVLASEGGITGRTISGCSGNGCHSAQNTATTVSVQGLSGTSITMSPNETRTFTILVAHATQPKAGIDISVKNSGGSNVGTLAPVASLRLQAGELTHTTAHPNITGAGAPFTFTWTAPAAQGDYLLRASGNAINNNGNEDGDFWNFMNTVTITVAASSVTLNAPNGGETLCRGSQTNITWTSSISGNVKIEFTTDGTNFTEITTVPASPASYAWTIPTTQATGSTYKIRISDATNATVNDMSNANFSILSTPSIVTQPKSDSICTGSPIALSITTDNPTGYTYQWRKNGNIITGATETAYSITSATAADAGSYDVIITGCSPLTSNAATIIMNTAPAITSNPNDTTVCPGSAVTFSASATGTNLTYQWKHNNTSISGATNATLVLPTTTTADTGSYILVVSGKCNPAQPTNAAFLHFTPPPAINKQPRDTTVCLGEAVQFSVVGTGNGLTYQWQKNGTNIDGAQSSNLVIPSVSAGNLGSYTAIIKNSCNLTATSTAAILNARESVAITEEPRDTAVQTNLTATFNVRATGTDVRYQWMKNNINRPGDTLPTLTIANVKLSDSGNYKCVVRNLCGIIESSVAKLTVTAPPAGAALALSTGTVDFGCNKVKSTKDSILTNVVFNGGGQPLNVTAVTISGADMADYSIVSGGNTFTLAPNEKHTITLRFTPSSKTVKNAAIEFTSNSTTSSPKLVLTGKGCAGTITAFKENIGTIQVGAKLDTTVKICNTGDFNLVVSSITIGGTNAAEFTLGNLPTFPTVIKPGDCLTVGASCMPIATGIRSAEISIKTDEGDFTISLEATATPSTGVDEATTIMSGVSVYPNPSVGNVVFTGEVEAPMPINVRIFDGLGNAVYQTTIGVTSVGSFNFAWDGSSNGSNNSNGIYTALLTIGVQRVRVPFVILR